MILIRLCLLQNVRCRMRTYQTTRIRTRNRAAPQLSRGSRATALVAWIIRGVRGCLPPSFLDVRSLVNRNIDHQIVPQFQPRARWTEKFTFQGKFRSLCLSVSFCRPLLRVGLTRDAEEEEEEPLFLVGLRRDAEVALA